MKDLMQYAAFLIIGLSLIACDKCENSEILCFTPPEPIYFQLYSESAQDVIASDDFELRLLKIFDTSKDQLVPFDTLSIAGEYYLSGESIGWKEGLNVYQFTYSNKELFTFSIEANEISQDCCTYTEYDNISLSTANFEELSEGNLGPVYKVTVSL